MSGDHDKYCMSHWDALHMEVADAYGKRHDVKDPEALKELLEHILSRIEDLESREQDT